MNFLISFFADNPVIVGLANFGGAVAFLWLIYSCIRTAVVFSNTTIRNSFNVAVYSFKKRRAQDVLRASIDIHWFIYRIFDIHTKSFLVLLYCGIMALGDGNVLFKPPDFTNPEEIVTKAVAYVLFVFAVSNFVYATVYAKIVCLVREKEARRNALRRAKGIPIRHVK